MKTNFYHWWYNIFPSFIFWLIKNIIILSPTIDSYFNGINFTTPKSKIKTLLVTTPTGWLGFLQGRYLSVYLVKCEFLFIHFPTDKWRPPRSQRWRKTSCMQDWKVIVSVAYWVHLPDLNLHGFLHYRYFAYARQNSSISMFSHVILDHKLQNMCCPPLLKKQWILK